MRGKPWRTVAVVGALATGAASAQVPADFQARSVTRSYVQSLAATPDKILPLLTAAREGKWAEGFSPRILHPGTPPGGQGGVFITTHEGRAETVWTTSVYDPSGRVEYFRVTPGSDAVQIRIRLEARPGGATAAHVAYTYTALSPKGNQLVEAMSQERFDRSMQAWETALDHYLKTGRRLAHH